MKIYHDKFDNAVGSPFTSFAYQLSWSELKESETYENSVFFHRMKSTKVICNYEVEAVIKFGEVIFPGSDLPSGHNLSNYVESGRFNLLDFFDNKKVQFIYLATESEKHAAYTLYETDCEQFFNISGYVFSPKLEWIGVRNYEDTAMLSYNMQSVYIDEDWVVKEYIWRVKKRDWDNKQAWRDKQFIELKK